MESCDLNEIYDRRLLVKGTLASYILLVVYIPIGMALIALRLILSAVSSLLVSVSPTLRTSPHFAKMYANLMGIHVKQVSSPSTGGPTSNVLFVSNQRSELDLLAVKSCVPHSDYVNETPLHGLTRLLLAPVWSLAHTAAISANDFFKNPKNYPIVVFAEQMPTRARALLAFNSAAFQPDNQPPERQLQPVAIEMRRPGLPLSLNHPNSLVNVMLVLFSPVNTYELTFLQVQTSVQACREAIGGKLGASLSSLTHEDVRKALIRESHQNALSGGNRSNQQGGRNRQQQQQQSMGRSQTTSTMSFNDTSRLALQIKDILPNASYELIQRHIRAAPTLDIDTVLASILDDADYAEEQTTIKTSMSSPILQQQQQQQQVTPSSGGETAKKSPQSATAGRFKSYEERKFDLLNEARRRYLQKNPPTQQQHNH